MVVTGLDVDAKLKLLNVGALIIGASNAEPGRFGFEPFEKIQGLQSAVSKLYDVEVNKIGSGSGNTS